MVQDSFTFQGSKYIKQIVSSFMQNVGALTLFWPVMSRIFATSNSFLTPRQQVDASIMGSGGYRVSDYIRAGSVMTVLFLVVMIFMMNLLF